jgi:sialate O-acetylesterase
MPMLNRTQFLFALLLPAAVLSAHAQEKSVNTSLRVHNLFQSNMVLQRDKPLNVWGWSQPSDTVTVAFGKASSSASADKNGRWVVQLPVLKASTTAAEMSISSSGGERIQLENILVGDVWVLGGQSNMQWGIGGVNEGNLEVASANFPNIRMLTIPKIFGPELKTNFPRAEEFSLITGEEQRDGDWEICTPETVGSMSAIGYVMARRIHMATQVPIGIVNTSRGGTTVEAWTPLTRLRKLESPEVKARLAEADEQLAAYDPKADLQKQIDKFEAKFSEFKKAGKDTSHLQRPTTPDPGPSATHKMPGNCYSSVISPIAGFAVKGAIFHQGYNNCFSGVQGARMYRAVFPEMIRAWREAFQDEKLPFCILSQCTAGRQQTHDEFLIHLADIGARIREAQYQTFLDFYSEGDKDIGFVSTYDLRHSNFHPRVKIPAGERAAIWALFSQYGIENGMQWVPPVLQEMKSLEGSLELTFDQAVGDNSDGTEMSGFAIAGADMKFQPAEVTHKIIGQNGRKVQSDKTTLVLKSPLVEKPVHFRYAWGRNPMGDIQLSVRFGNTVMLPTQRSDDWSNADLLDALTGVEAENPGQLSRGESNALRAALEKEDRRRKLAEANAIIKQVTVNESE